MHRSAYNPDICDSTWHGASLAGCNAVCRRRHGNARRIIRGLQSRELEMGRGSHCAATHTHAHTLAQSPNHARADNFRMAAAASRRTTPFFVSFYSRVFAILARVVATPFSSRPYLAPPSPPFSLARWRCGHLCNFFFVDFIVDAARSRAQFRFIFRCILPRDRAAAATAAALAPASVAQELDETMQTIEFPNRQLRACSARCERSLPVIAERQRSARFASAAPSASAGRLHRRYSAQPR